LATAISDIVDGATSSKGNVFIGLVPLMNSIGELNTNFDSVKNTLNDLSVDNPTGALATAHKSGVALLDSMSGLPGLIGNQ
jgi:hypothetical protein